MTDILKAQKIAYEQYGIPGNAFKLVGEKDYNFKIQSEHGLFLLKISHPDETYQNLEFQCALLLHLEKSTLPKYCFPAIIKNNNNEYYGTTSEWDGLPRYTRLLQYMEGRLWSTVNPITDSLLLNLGKLTGNLSVALASFSHQIHNDNFEWDLANGLWTENYLKLFDSTQQHLIRYFLGSFRNIQSGYKQLRKSVIHNDVNDNNIVVDYNLKDPSVKSIIDFGDAVFTQSINELAITIAYAVMKFPDPIQAACIIIKGYNQKFQLEVAEINYLYDLVAIRLIISVTKSALNKKADPSNTYLQISDAQAWNLLSKWIKIHPDFALYSFRYACELSPHPEESKFASWATKNQIYLRDLFPANKKEKIHLLDMSVSSNWIGHPDEYNDPAIFQEKIDHIQKKHPTKLIAGGYLEPRLIYTTNSYQLLKMNGPENRTIHLGIDFWLSAGTSVCAPFSGVIDTVTDDKGDKEYGGLIILKHVYKNSSFYTLYGHLSPQSILDKGKGQFIERGTEIGVLGNYPENGNWAPHLHFQILLSKFFYKDDFPGVACNSEIDLWKSICPNPNLLFQIKNLTDQYPVNTEQLIYDRKNYLGPNLSLSYKQPLNIVRGSGVYLFDNMGRKYLDTINNVAHVGHENIAVVKAGQEQMAVLNTNTRYLHPAIHSFAKELLSTFPPELSVVYFVNSGSEANELALRMAYTVTGHKNIIALEMGYHGNTNACIDISSYKLERKGGKSIPEHTHIAPLPDTYRGIHSGQNAGEKYAENIKSIITSLKANEMGLAGFICESILSCAGQIELPKGYLSLAYKYVRDAGGVCIADEVQIGCGRIGTHFWGFEMHDVTPDIVTIGKPLGNGHPVAAVVTSADIANAFSNGMEYFNTFGGNPVSCAIGKEVLQIVKRDRLQENALSVGNYLKMGLKKLQAKYPIIGDVRGQGLFLGFELVDIQHNPLPEKTKYLVNQMKNRGVLMSVDGKDENVIKIKPPVIFSKKDADTLLSNLGYVFEHNFMKDGINL